MRAISLPFRFDGYGTVASTTDLSRIWADRVRTVVSTKLGERVMRPTFGARLPDDLFEALDETPELVRADVTQAFADWLPEVELTGVDVVEFDEGSGTARLSITYQIPSVVTDTDNNYSIII